MKKFRQSIAVFLTMALLLTAFLTVPVMAEDRTTEVDRIFGENRCQTAVAVSEDAYPEGADTVIIVTANNFPDALAGSVLAHKLGAPILLVRDNVTDMALVLAEIERLGATKAYVLGGDKAVAEELEALVKTKVPTERIAGESRYETAQRVAEMVGMPNDGHVFLVSGSDFPDALAIAPVAARLGVPILLTRPDYLREDVLDALEALNIKSVTLIGGPKAISEELEALLEDEDIEVEERVFGDSREDTAVAIATKYFGDITDVLIANGRTGYPDALVAGYLGALRGIPLLLVEVNKVRESTASYLEDKEIETITILGGDKVVSEDVEEELAESKEEEEPGEPGVPDPGPTVKQAHWNAAGGVGIAPPTAGGAAGKLYQGYELLDANNERINLVASNIAKMTVLNPGETTAIELVVGDDADPLLWFHVRKGTGAYKYTVKTTSGDTYQATLNWTAPEVVAAVKQGDDLVLCGDGVYRYHYKIDIAMQADDTLVYRMKPTGVIDQQIINDDSDDFSIYFRPTDTDNDFTQLEGDHTYLIKKGDTWHESVIHYEDKVKNSTREIGYNSLQKAIEDANEGDTIEVRAYTFDEAITINKSITLQGVNVNNDGRSEEFVEEGSILRGGVTITGGDVTLKGLTIETMGILACNYSNLTVENCRIQEINEAMSGSPAGSYIGLDVKSPAASKTNGPVTIHQNRFKAIGQENDTGTAIRMVKVDGSITITDNLIEDVTKNGINLYSNCLKGENAKLTITGNTIQNWDSDKDQEESLLDGKQGGRAVRIDFVGAHTSATADITENKFIPPAYTESQVAVDPDFVKLTTVGILIDLTKNYWGTEAPDFGTILKVEGSRADECEYVPYYTELGMLSLSEEVS